jgi:hypothetical protein
MFLHQFGEDFVLALELLLQEGDPPVFGVAGSPGAGLEGGSGVLEELLLPTIEHRRVDAVLVTEIRDRRVFEEMEPKNGDLLLGREALSGFLGHGRTSARDCSLFEQTVCPISTEAKQATHRSGILAYYDVRITSGPMEGTNNKIKTMKRQAYGFRDKEFFKLKILAIHETRYELVG